jgi:hypothetical protein
MQRRILTKLHMDNRRQIAIWVLCNTTRRILAGSVLIGAAQEAAVRYRTGCRGRSPRNANRLGRQTDPGVAN